MMENVFSVIMVALMGVLGGLPTLYLTVSIPVVLGQKIYRKVKYGRSLFDCAERVPSAKAPFQRGRCIGDRFHRMRRLLF